MYNCVSSVHWYCYKKMPKLDVTWQHYISINTDEWITCANTYVVFLLNTTITSTSSVNVTTSWVVTEKLCNTSHYRIIKWHKMLHRSCLHKATFHYSRQLQTWSKTKFSTRFANRFSTSSCGFTTCFWLFFVENLVANLLHQCPHVKIDAAGSLVRTYARQTKCRTNPFQASQWTCWNWIFVTYFIKLLYFIICAYHAAS